MIEELKKEMEEISKKVTVKSNDKVKFKLPDIKIYSTIVKK